MLTQSCKGVFRTVLVNAWAALPGWCDVTALTLAWEKDRWQLSTHDLTHGVVGRCALSSKRGSALMPLHFEVCRTPPSALHT